MTFSEALDSIDYSMITAEPEQPLTVLRSLKIAAAITLGILAAVGLGALFTAGFGKRDNIMAGISAAFLLVFIAVVMIYIAKGIRKYKRQRQQMGQFADRNGWSFDGTRRDVDGLLAVPKSLYLNPRQAMVRFTISGTVGNAEFQLAHLMGQAGHSLALRLLLPFNQLGWAWVTVMIISGDHSLNKDPSFLYETDGRFTYVINYGNALSAKEIKAMFSSLKTAD